MQNKAFLTVVPLLISASLLGCGSSSTGSTSTGGSSTGGSSTGGSSTGGSSTGGSSTGGSSSSTGGGSSTGGVAGNGNCVAITAPVAGLKYTNSIKAALNTVNTTGAIAFDTEFLTVSDTESVSTVHSVTESVVSAGGFDITTTSTTDAKNTTTYSVTDSFFRITKIVIETAIEAVTNPGGTVNTATTITTEQDPFLQGPRNEVCENQVWTNDYTSTTTTTTGFTPGGVPVVGQVNTTNTILAINVNKTVPAGTFNTFQIENQDGNRVDLQWIDIDSGAVIASESRNNSGVLTAKGEATSVTVP